MEKMTTLWISQTNLVENCLNSRDQTAKQKTKPKMQQKYENRERKFLRRSFNSFHTFPNFLPETLRKSSLSYFHIHVNPEKNVT